MINRKLSIILPVYNEKESLLIMVRLLNSSLSIQTEIIIVHDNLNDNSLDSAKKLADEYDNIKMNIWIYLIIYHHQIRSPCLNDNIRKSYSANHSQ